MNGRLSEAETVKMKDLNIRVAFSAIDKLTRPVNAARNSVGGLSESLKKTQSSIKDLETQSQAFNRLNERVKKTSQQLATTQRAFDGLNKAQKTGTVLTDAQRERMTALAAKLDRLNASRSQETAKLQQASQALRAHGVSLAGGDRTIQSAIRRTEQYNQTLERERRQLAAVTNARARYDRLSTTAGKLRTGGAMAVGASAGAGYAAGRFLAPAVGFDEEMSRVGALTRLDKGDEQFAALRAQAKKLGAETAFTTRDAASGQAFLAMAGFTPQSIQAALPGVLNMALAGGMDLGESADIGSNILTQFKLSSDQMDRVGDTLTAAFTRTNTDLRALGDTMKYAGPVAANLGISLEQASAMAGMLANNGLRGSDAGTVAKKMADNLGGDLKELDSAWEAFRIQIEELADGALRKLTQALTGTIGAMTEWANKNPQLSKTLLAVGGSVLALTAGIGATSLAIGLLLGPLAKLQLGFALLTSGSGLGGAVTLFSRLFSAISGPLGGVRGWGIVFSSMTGNAGKLAGALAPLRGLLAAAFISPGAALGGIVKGLGSLLLRLTGIPAIMGIASSALSMLGGALSLLLSPIGLIGAAFIATGLLIWRFWEPIKAFFAGFFASVMQALTPFRDAFAGLAPVFDVISNAVSQLWQWFSNLLSPMTTSKETLDQCASAGETFGKVFGLAIQGLMLPLTGLAKMVGWILEKLGLIPSGIETAKAKAEKVQKELTPAGLAMLQDKVGALTGDVKAVTAPPIAPPSPVIAADTGTQRRLQKIADNTGGMLDETKKRIGPGDIVFKNLPRALAVHGAWQEAQSTQGANLTQLSERPVIAAASAPIKPAAEIQAIGGQSSKQISRSAQNTTPDEIHIHIHMHGNFSNDARDIARMTADAVQAEFNKRFRTRSSFSDNE